MMFTPTKWTHHFGVFAGLAGSLGALAAVAVTAAAMRSRRNRTMFAAVGAVRDGVVVRQRQRLVVRLQLRCAVVESVPGVALRLHHHAARPCRSLALLLAAWFHFYGHDGSPPDGGSDGGWRRILQSPLAIAAWLLVFFEVLSLTLA